MRIFYIILSIILLTSTQAKSQAKGPMPDPEKKVVKFYPNPAISYITFEVVKDSNKSYTLQIYNFLGRKVKDVTEITPKTVVNVSELVRGIYIFQLKDPNGRITDSGTFQINK
ncbi:T9SS type A sorting domain-containing protein [Flavitalea sp. BT771]|uniref:T9SS type A sorting domain-containing protein n=1 Tax=Flavitalea sp. BT771 TaxID=3063329 RepID=UPI0026E37E2B|nr:T9SS type A sorting domain-containing protein [Flavitalea sp. BT771]MDO6435091.1 T9SS type A sorting domain-containing protein [Flavitalea sp. BT771]MDV6223991.1 T9SS type A sorting domain-containing protein [Flavitalea sp. BT771]